MRVTWKLLAGCMFVLVAMSAAGASSALAAPSYLFDPQLSLTGDCATSADDPVPDPGCPYPPPPGGPSEKFVRPTGMALDSYGDIYVAVEGPRGEDKAHVDIFNAESEFITELPQAGEPRSIAVDSKGYLYVYSLTPSNTTSASNKLFRYKPTVYNPAAGEIGYETPPTVVAASSSDYSALAVNPLNDHLFVNVGTGGVSEPKGSAVQEFGSGDEGNPQLDADVASVCCFDGPGLAIDAARGRLYATDQISESRSTPRIIRVFELAAPHDLIETIDGSSTPEGNFVAEIALGLAVDESTGNIYAYDEEKLNVIYELSEDGQYLSSIKHSLSSNEHKEQVVVDNGENSPHGALSGEGRYLWATADPGGVGHAFAFRPAAECPPMVESISVAHVGEGEALLEAEVEPCQLQTSYRFEYVTQQQFDESQFEGASLAAEGTIPAGGVPVKVLAGASGLSPATRYVFRVVATNTLGSDEAQSHFKTYPAAAPPASCANAAFRSGPSALLPDCRAYELVTPANTNGLAPFGAGGYGPAFLSRTVAIDGGRIFYRIEGGIVPGSEGTGSLAGDPYLATRGPEGWSTVGTGGKGSEFQAVESGGRSPDQGYLAWNGVVNGTVTTYLRFPDGHSEPLGQGALGEDPGATPRWISEGGGHVVFTSGVLLEEGASPGRALYDRTGDGVTHVVSLLPDDSTPAGSVTYAGASVDGQGIAFRVDTQSGPRSGHSKLYLRYNDEETFEVGEDATYEGVAEGGRRVFYLEAGKLYAFDIEDGKIPFTTSGEATVINISPDGSTAYFVSPSKLTNVPNPLGAKAKTGEENLYLSREGTIEFIGIVTERDVVGKGANTDLDGLGLWAGDVRTIGAVPQDPSRTSGDGGVLLFQSRAELTGFDSGGHAQIYRYDSIAKTLSCLSCNPIDRPAVADARLHSIELGSLNPGPIEHNDRIENLTPGGRRAFFESPEALVPADVDGLWDVYEWEGQGVGTCTENEGCVFLVSSGRSSHDDYLYGVSASGEDVFIETNDLLDPRHDPDETSSIYDARVGGGFGSASQTAECSGDACQPVARPPERPVQALRGLGNVPPGRRCPKAKHAVRKRGKVRCVARHAKSRHHHRAGHNRRKSR
jgi:hypothetical protein